MKEPKFVLKKRTDGQFMFNLVAPNGEIILTSEGYTTKENCLNGISSVKENCEFLGRYEKHEEDYDLKYWWFNLKARNGEIIGTSEMYESEQGMEWGIDAVKEYGKVSEIKDRTGWIFNIFKF